MTTITRFFYLFLIAYMPIMHPASIVYNMRVAEVTRKHGLEGEQELGHVAALTPIGQIRTLRSKDTFNFVGGLASYIYAKTNYYIKVDGAVADVRYTINNVFFTGTRFDDVLITGGYGHKIGKKFRLAYSALFGIPTHRDATLDVVQFGVSHVGLGGQIDSAYQYSKMNTIFCAARCIYFVPRTIEVTDPCLFSTFNCRSYRFFPGYLADIFISHQTAWHGKNRFEFGYDTTFLRNTDIQPIITSLSENGGFIRHNFFWAYSRLAPIKTLRTGFIVAMSAGFDSTPRLYGSKYFATFWGSWGVNF